MFQNHNHNFWQYRKEGDWAGQHSHHCKFVLCASWSASPGHIYIFSLCLKFCRLLQSNLNTGDKELMEGLMLDAEVTSTFHSDNTRWGKSIFHQILDFKFQASPLQRARSEACLCCHKKRTDEMGGISRWTSWRRLRGWSWQHPGAVSWNTKFQSMIPHAIVHPQAFRSPSEQRDRRGMVPEDGCLQPPGGPLQQFSSLRSLRHRGGPSYGGDHCHHCHHCVKVLK